MIDARPAPLDAPLSRQLIAALDAELSARYPEAGANHFRLDPEEVAPGRGVFLIAFDGDTPIGCGAIRRLDAGTAELKRMYVVPAHRGRGVGHLLVDALEEHARDLGITRLVLETGLRQPEAVALYERAGFAVIPPFGEYLDSPHSLCMGKSL
jgi:putative acetyltransferase